MKIIEEFQKAQLKKIPEFRVGDTLKVFLKIVEGEKERVQTFAGILICRKGKGLTETITLRRIAFGEGVERILPIHSPRIEKIEVVQRGHVRRSKLYYLRDRIGKHARVQDSKEESVGLEGKKIQKPKVLEAKPKAAKVEVTEKKVEKLDVTE